MLAEALRYAALNWAVFPLHTRRKHGRCSCGQADCPSVAKHPRIQDWDQQATVEPNRIRAWWRRWPRANIGLAMSQSGLVVLDVDPRHGGRVERLPLAEADRITPTARTGGGGCHLFFRAPIGFEISNSNQGLPEGVDVRASGGYAVAPPSIYQSGERYAWLPDRAPWAVAMLPLPASLMPLLKMKEEPPAEGALPPVPPRLPTEPGERHPYVQSALDSELEDLAGATEGHRNITLNKAAFCLGQFVAMGLLPRAKVEAHLAVTARGIGLPEMEIQRTIRSGLEAGLQHPRRRWPDLR